MRVMEAGPVFRSSGSGRDNCGWSTGVSGAAVIPEECDQDNAHYVTNHITQTVFQSVAARKKKVRPN